MIRRLIAWLSGEPSIEFRREVLRLLWDGRELASYELKYFTNECGAKSGGIQFYFWMNKLEDELIVTHRDEFDDLGRIRIYRLRVNL